MGHYRSDRRHAEFLLLDVLAADGAPEAFADFDAGTVRDVLAGAEEHAHSRLADSFAAGERQRPRLDPDSGRVLLPPDLRQALRDHLDSDWLRLDLPPERTGFHVPPSLRWAATEFVLGANPAVAMCTQLVPSAVRLLEEQGTPQQQQLAELVLERGWTVTMVLTEPEAGSDVGAARTRAVPQPDGSWHLEGSKRFITWASHDAAENVVHLVLARPQGLEGAGGPGTRGLSLFVVPEHHHDPETGEPGERNGVEVVSLEHKMGLAGSPTCELALGAGKPAVGHLLGDRHEGLRQMFEIITYVRMMVGAKAAAALSSGHLHAREYAEVRIQGRAPDAGPGAADIPIIDHPDVRRSLLTQRAYAEGSRALVLHTATQLDRIEAAASRGERDPDAEARHRLLLPIVKTWCAENAFRVLATESLQTLGGSGYTADHPLEQYVRDTKIDSIYEGTTGIQALDLLQRRLVPDETTIGVLLAEVAATASELAGHPELGVEGALLAEAAEAVRGLVRLSVDAAGADPALAALGATRVLLAIGDLVVGWLLLRTARVAADLLAAGERGEEAANLRSYVASGRWFARQVLPRTGSDLTSAELLDRGPLELERSSV